MVTLIKSEIFFSSIKFVGVDTMFENFIVISLVRLKLIIFLLHFLTHLQKLTLQLFFLTRIPIKFSNLCKHISISLQFLHLLPPPLLLSQSQNSLIIKRNNPIKQHPPLRIFQHLNLHIPYLKGTILPSDPSLRELLSPVHQVKHHLILNVSIGVYNKMLFFLFDGRQSATPTSLISHD